MRPTPHRERRHRRSHRRGVALAVLVSVAATAAEAQPLLTRKYLTGDWGQRRPTIEADGFHPFMSYTGMTWANLNGGRETGVRVNGFLEFGLEVDFAKVGLWNGLGAHVDFHWWQGPEPTKKLIGGLLAMALSEWEAADTFRVYNIYLRQSFLDDHWVIKLGQIAADTDFMVSRYAGVFLNAAFGDLPSQNLNLGAPVYPLAAPGVFMSGRPWSWLTGRFGAYTADSGEDVAGNHGFGWNIGNNVGYTFFTELGFEPPNEMPPGAYTLGGIFNTDDPPQFGSNGRSTEHYEIYAMIDQAILVHDDGSPRLGVFARMSGTPQDANTVVSLYADGGIAWFGPIPSRPNDTVGVAISVLRFTDEFEHEISNPPVCGGESAIELTYQIAVTPWLVVQPDFQCFFNPPVSRRDAQALGIEAVALF